MSKWRVKKRDGVRLVLDASGRIRHSCDNHFSALTFALLKGERKPAPSYLATYWDTTPWSDILRQVFEQKRDNEDGLEEDQ